MLTLLALLAAEPVALAETGTPIDTGTPADTGESDEDGCGKSDQQSAVFLGLLLTIGAGMTVGRRAP